jgi:hypothetical protein
MQSRSHHKGGNGSGRPKPSETSILFVLSLSQAAASTLKLGKRETQVKLLKRLELFHRDLKVKIDYWRKICGAVTKRSI